MYDNLTDEELREYRKSVVSSLTKSQGTVESFNLQRLLSYVDKELMSRSVLPIGTSGQVLSSSGGWGYPQVTPVIAPDTEVAGYSSYYRKPICMNHVWIHSGGKLLFCKKCDADGEYDDNGNVVAKEKK